MGLWLAAVFVVLVAAFPYYSPKVSKMLVSSEKAQVASTAIPVEHLTLSVQGMTCPVCAQGVERRLNSIHGVTKASVSYELKRAEIDYDPHLVKLGELEQPFRDAGFKAARQ